MTRVTRPDGTVEWIEGKGGHNRYTPTRRVVRVTPIEAEEVEDVEFRFVELREWPLSQDAKGMVDWEWGDAAGEGWGDGMERGEDNDEE